VTTATYDGTGLGTSKAIAYRMLGRSKSPDEWLRVKEGHGVERSFFQKIRDRAKEYFRVGGETIEQEVHNHNTSDPADTLESALYMTANDLRDSQERLDVDCLRTARNALVKQANIYAKRVKVGTIRKPKISTDDFKHVFNLIQGRIAYEKALDANELQTAEFSMFFRDRREDFGNANFSRQYDFRRGLTDTDYLNTPRPKAPKMARPEPKKEGFFRRWGFTTAASF
tara:strand:+ start:42 stop:722 length:681 start_codon:yes stop_codon:yes gene_type:complete